MRLFIRAGMAVALVSLSSAPALACSRILPRHPPTQLEIDRVVNNRFRRAAAVVEVVAETDSSFERPAAMRVLRVFKGRLRVGARLEMTTVPDSMCGAGGFAAGARGIVIIDAAGSPALFSGFLYSPDLESLRVQGLLPAR